MIIQILSKRRTRWQSGSNTVRPTHSYSVHRGLEFAHAAARWGDVCIRPRCGNLLWQSSLLLSNSYANLVVEGPQTTDVIAALNASGRVAYVAAGTGRSTVVMHEDYGAQETLAAELSQTFQCPALLTMVFGGTVLLYQLYANGQRVDAYVSTPHDGLELDGPPPEGNTAVLCETFNRERSASSVERILHRPTKPGTDYAYAINRHGELLRALGLPLFAAGASFAAIEAGELPHAAGFDPSTLVRTGV